MIDRLAPSAFKATTGPTVALFDALAEDPVPAPHDERRRRLGRPGRRRAGGGDHFGLDPADQLLLTVVRLRPKGVGAPGDPASVGVGDGHRGASGRPRGARRAAGLARMRAGAAAGRSRDVGSWWGVRSGGCAGIRR